MHIYKACYNNIVLQYACRYSIKCVKLPAQVVNHLLHRSDQQFAIDAAAARNISYVRQIFDSLDWTEESYRMLERIGQTGKQWQMCSTPVCTYICMYSIVCASIFIRVHNYMYVA